MSLRVEVAPDAEGVALGIVRAWGVRFEAAPPELAARIEERVVRAAESAVKPLVRDMLRHGKYKPTGRGKPASEYLLGAATEGRFPAIAGLVDLPNLISLTTALPISVIDVGRAGTEAFRLRRGREGERYVFNQVGHEIELRDLLLVATLPDDVACANPVKDSMRTKVAEDTREVAAFVYAPAALHDLARDAAAELAEGLRRWCGATAVHSDG